LQIAKKTTLPGRHLSHLTNQTINNFAHQTFRIFQAAMNDMLTQDVLKHVLNDSFKIHAPTFKFLKQLLPLSLTETTFPLDSVIQHVLRSGQSFYNILNTITPISQLNLMIKQHQKFCSDKQNTYYCVVDTTGSFSVKNYHRLFTLNQVEVNVSKFDHFIHRIQRNDPPNMIFNTIMNHVTDSSNWTTVVVVNDYSKSSPAPQNSKLEPSQVLEIDQKNVTITTQKWCTSEGSWDWLRDKSTLEKFDLNDRDNDKHCIKSRAFSKKTTPQPGKHLNPLNEHVLFIINSSYSTVFQRFSLTHSVYVINDGYIHCEVSGSAGTIYSLIGNYTHGMLICKTIDYCALDMRFYATRRAKNI